MSTETQIPNRLYFAAWRWHFYAGLYVIPFMLMLAVTSGDRVGAPYRVNLFGLSFRWSLWQPSCRRWP